MWRKKRRAEKLAVTGSRTQDTSGLSRQCYVTKPQQLNNHQPPQSSVVVQWQSTGGSSQRCPGFASRWLPAFTFLYLHLITSKFIYFQREARCSEQIITLITQQFTMYFPASIFVICHADKKMLMKKVPNLYGIVHPTHYIPQHTLATN